jgi:hypothetical protein
MVAPSVANSKTITARSCQLQRPVGRRVPEPATAVLDGYTALHAGATDTSAVADAARPVAFSSGLLARARVVRTRRRGLSPTAPELEPVVAFGLSCGTHDERVPVPAPTAARPAGC